MFINKCLQRIYQIFLPEKISTDRLLEIYKEEKIEIFIKRGESEWKESRKAKRQLEKKYTKRISKSKHIMEQSEEYAQDKRKLKQLVNKIALTERDIDAQDQPFRHIKSIQEKVSFAS